MKNFFKEHYMVIVAIVVIAAVSIMGVIAFWPNQKPAEPGPSSSEPATLPAVDPEPIPMDPELTDPVVEDDDEMTDDGTFVVEPSSSSEPEVSSQTSAPEASEPAVSEPQTPSSVPENPASEPEVPESSEAPQNEPVPSTPSKSGGTQPGDRVYVPGFGWTIAGENGGSVKGTEYDHSGDELSGELNPNASFG